MAEEKIKVLKESRNPKRPPFKKGVYPPHLLPYKMDSERGRKLGSMKRSPEARHNMSVAQKLRVMRDQGLDSARSKELYEILTNECISSLDHRMLIERMKKMCENGDLKDLDIVSRNIALWHKQRFGDKHVIDSKVSTVDLNRPLSDDIRSMLLGEGDEED